MDNCLTCSLAHHQAPHSPKLTMDNCLSPNRNEPWGKSECADNTIGDFKDVTGVPQRLESITIRSGWVIDSLKFSYKSQDGKTHTKGPWGGFGSINEKTIKLPCGEFVNVVSGTTGEYEDEVVIQSLKFVTNKGNEYEFGRKQKNGTPFCSRGKVVGFHGYSGNYLNSIGTYTV